MQLLGKFFDRLPLLDEILDGLKLVFRTCLESARVMEYEARVGPEYELIFDIVVSALNQSMSRRSRIIEGMSVPPLWVRELEAAMSVHV